MSSVCEVEERHAYIYCVGEVEGAREIQDQVMSDLRSGDDEATSWPCDTKELLYFTYHLKQVWTTLKVPMARKGGGEECRELAKRPNTGSTHP